MASVATMNVDNTEMLICEVEKRPALFRKCLKEYSDRKLKETLWSEVCESVVPNWNELSAEMKSGKGKEVKSKWKNLRTCFKRELGAQKSAISGKNGKKRRKYIYFDQLLFLLPSLEDRKTKGNSSPSSIDINEGLEESDTEETEITELPRNPIRKKETKIDFVESLLQILQKKQEEEKDIDEDKCFLLSLLPSFRKFNDEQKLTARIEILKVLRRVRLSENGTCFPSPPFPAHHNVHPTDSHFADNSQTSLPTTSKHSSEPLSRHFNLFVDNQQPPVSTTSHQYPHPSTPNPVPSQTILKYEDESSDE